MHDCNFALNRITGPAIEPVTLDEAKLHCRVDIDDDDTLITNMIISAREQIEVDILGGLLTQSWELALDGFPISSLQAIQLSRPPLQSITSITYTDTNGDEQTWDSSKYQVDTKGFPGRVLPAYGESYPSTRQQMNSVVISYVAGHVVTDHTSGLLVAGTRYLIKDYKSDDDFTNVGAASNASGVSFVATGTTPTKYESASVLTDFGLLPQSILQALLMLVGHWYEHRESYSDAPGVSEVPQSYTWAIAPHKRWIL